jgi:HlyD family type I secretion membrane fusion protein
LSDLLVIDLRLLLEHPPFGLEDLLFVGDKLGEFRIADGILECGIGSEVERLCAVLQCADSRFHGELDLSNKFFNEQNDLLAKVNSDLAQVEERIGAAKDVLSRTRIKAPVGGIIMNLRFKTSGAVVRAGEPILDIVPTDEDLVIEARIQPNDINTPKPGQVARVHLTPHHMRYTNLLPGSLRDISADTYTDEKIGARYYKANVIVDHARIRELGANIELSPGMPAEIYIRTGEHTLFTYLIEPFSRSLRRSFRER